MKRSEQNRNAFVLKFFQFHGVAGKGIITGQHTQTNPMEEISYIREKTGYVPKLQGFELLAYSPNINYEDASKECLTEVEENKETVETAIKWAKETKGLVSDIIYPFFIHSETVLYIAFKIFTLPFLFYVNQHF